jgi:hypothetical protein
VRTTNLRTSTYLGTAATLNPPHRGCPISRAPFARSGTFHCRHHDLPRQLSISVTRLAYAFSMRRCLYIVLEVILGTAVLYWVGDLIGLQTILWR